MDIQQLIEYSEISYEIFKIVIFSLMSLFGIISIIAIIIDLKNRCLKERKIRKLLKGDKKMDDELKEKLKGWLDTLADLENEITLMKQEQDEILRLLEERMRG